MAQLAIKGHATRNKEVIEILEMLGGENKYKLNGCNIECAYYKKNGVIYSTSPVGFNNINLLTLEEFLEKFPYKVGDNVQRKGATSCGSVYEVEKMRWVDDHVEYIVKRLWCWNDHYTFTAEDLQPFKEETMEENLTIQDIRDNNAEWLLNKLREMPAEGTLRIISDLYDELHKPQYPKTYEECCKILNANPHVRLVYNLTDGETYSYDLDNLQRYDNLRRLLICRDSYWKIAGEEMGLNKSWEPGWRLSDKRKYCIVNTEGNIMKWVQKTNNTILAFPTEEMRDEFYENFKYLIEQCKELL